MTIKGWLSVYWRLGVASFFALIGVVSGEANNSAFAQQEVSADPSLGTTVTVNGTTFQITSGTTVGDKNLFHSFSNFSVPIGGSADFRNAPTISNILARVTGGTVSDIQGLIRAQGNANLFLMNPNGIVFGLGAQLDIGGSFAATTASAIAFPNGGEFSLLSRVDSANSLLSVNPSAFLFNQIPTAGIENKSIAPAGLAPEGFNTFGLRVPDGKSMLLLGGNVNLDSGWVNAFGGRIELGGLAAAGTVGLNVDGSNLRLSFPDSAMRADVSLTNRALASVSGQGGGSVQIQGRNVNLSGNSRINSNTLGNQNSGDIFIRSSELNLREQSRVGTLTTGSGNSGNIAIETGNLILQERASIFTGSVLASGRAGNITVKATDSVSLINAVGLSTLSVGRGDGTTAEFGGNVTIQTQNLSLDSQAAILVSTFLGQENAGNLTVQATNSIKLANNSVVSTSSMGAGTGGNIFINTGNLRVQNGSSVFTNTLDPATFDFNSLDPRFYDPTVIAFITTLISNVSPGNFGQANTGNLTVVAADAVEVSGISANGNVSKLSTETFGAGTGGDLSVTTKRMVVRDGSSILSGTSVGSQGKGGILTVNASDFVELSGTTPNGQLSSGLSTDTQGTGKAGDLKITTGRLIVRDGAIAAARTFAEGQGGTLSVDAKQVVEITGTSINNQFGSGLSTATSGAGAAGNLAITTERLSVSNGGLVSAGTTAKGQGGNLTVNASDFVELSGTTPNGQFSSGLFTDTQGTGKAGDLKITTGRLSVRDGAVAAARTFAEGQGGTLSVDAKQVVEITGTSINSQFSSGLSTATSGAGAAGNLAITTERLSVSNGGLVSAATTAKGQGGNLTVNASDFVELSGTTPDGQFSSGLSTDTQGTGKAGDLKITTGRLSVRDGAVAAARTFAEGQGGTLSVDAKQVVEITGTSTNSQFSSGLSTVTSGAGAAGNLAITTERLSVSNGGLVSAATTAKGQGGNLMVNASGSVELSGTSVDGKNRSTLSASTYGAGDAQNLTINTRQLTIKDRAIVSASTFGQGNAGKISVEANDSINLSGGYIFSSVEGGATGDGGDIDIQTRSLTLTEGGEIAASVFRQQGNIPGGQGRGGDISVNASASLSISGVDPEGFSSGLFTNTQRGASGQGGNITINTDTFRLADGGVVNAQTLNPSNGGNIIINTNTFEALGGGKVLTDTFSSGRAGNIILNAQDIITISGTDPTYVDRFARLGGDIVTNLGSASGVFAGTDTKSQGEGGTISLATKNLYLTDTGRISAQSQGQGKGGNINITTYNTIEANHGEISTNATSAGGGDISIKARDIRLRNDSDIRTNSGGGDGGNIFLTANNIIALEDSDILAFAPQGRGGEIKFTTAAFLSNPPYRPTPSTTNLAALDILDDNGRADVNASGTVTGSISGIPDTTFLQNSLTELSQNPIDTNALIASSCIARGNKKEGTFIITGTGGLPNRPGDVSISTYPTGNVRGVESEGASGWKQGDPIIEPLGVYKLDSGRLVLSRECAR